MRQALRHTGQQSRVCFVRHIIAAIILLSFSFSPVLLAQTAGAVSKTDNTILLSRWTYGGTYALMVWGDTLLFGDGNYLRVANVADPQNPQLLGELEMPRIIGDINIDQQHAYVLLDTHSVSIVDLSNLTDLRQIGYLSTAWEGRELVFDSDRAYVVAGNKGLRTLDITDITAPQEIDSLLLGFTMQDLVIADSLVLVAAGNRGLRVININAAPVEVGFYDNGVTVQDVAYIGHQAIIATNTGVKSVDLSDLSNLQAADVGNNVELFQQLSVDGNYLATQGSGTGLILYEYQAPSFVEIASHNSDESSRGVILQAGRLFLANDMNGVRVFDVDTSAQTLTESSLLSNGSLLLQAVPIGERLYIRDVSGKIQIIDISDTQQPQRLGRFAVQGNPVTFAVADSIAYVATADSGLRIYDMTEHAAVINIGSALDSQEVTDVALSGSLLYIASPDSGLLVFDVIDPSLPQKVASGAAGEDIEYIKIHDQYAFAYRDQGMIIFDISDSSQFVEISRIDSSFVIDKVAVADNICYQMTHIGPDFSLRAWDVSDTANPQQVSIRDVQEESSPLAVYGTYVYFHERPQGIRIFDYSNPANPVEVGAFSNGGFRKDIAVQGDLVFAINLRNGFDIILHDKITGVDEPRDPQVAQSMQLRQNYPNPFNGRTQIEFLLQNQSVIQLVIFDVLGREVKTLFDGRHPEGSFRQAWDGTDNAGRPVASGVYLYRLTSGERSISRKLLLLQ